MLLAVGLLACRAEHVPLTHDAYIWQRQWTPALRAAVQAGAEQIRDWRVLAAQSDASGRLMVFPVDRATLASSGRPTILVVRLDGSLTQWDEAALLNQIDSLLNGWAGVPLAGLEIDYDCATARLPAYAHFLSALKPRLAGLPLSITALPTWLSSAGLAPLLAIPDESVLQVHAVLAPSQGLFDPQRSRQWLEAFAAHTTKPFRVALPTYGSRVSWDENGRLVAIQSEASSLTPGSDSRELSAAPLQVMQLLESLEHNPVAGLLGVVWFRLPTASDERAWSLETWRRVIQGTYREQTVTTAFEPGMVPGALDVVLRNDGEVDAQPASVVTLPDGCSAADGINGYTLVREGQRVSLTHRDPRLLRAHSQRKVGWTRCAPTPVSSPLAVIDREVSSRSSSSLP